ncbi:MAG: DUF5615 family PIN-like protein [Dehalococcoidia bacterium]
MKLLYDQNLSFRLVRRLATLYPDSAHARDVGLGEADDMQLWTYAATHGFVTVSKDKEYRREPK